MRTSTLSIAVVLAVNFLTFAIAASQEPPQTFTVTVKGADVQEVQSGIRLMVEIVNNTGSDFELSVREGEPPYSLRLHDDKGQSLTSNELRRKSVKDRRQKNVPLLFRPHEKKTYEVTYSKWLDDTGREAPVPAGVYTVSAIVRVLSYAQEMQPHAYLSAKLVESNRIIVTLR
jgi:hypothetical protein